LIWILNLLAKVLITLFFGYMLLVRPMKASAQNYDYSSVEAYINDHKKQRSLLRTRATLEYGNQLLHEISKDKAQDYKELNFDLDKYTRAFDVIDIIYQSARAAVNVYNTYDVVSDRIKGYKEMLKAYNDKVISRKKVSAADLELLEINYKAIQDIQEECTYLYRSVYDLIAYCSGAAACSTTDLLVVLESINDSLDRLKALVNGAYLSTWKFMQVRMGYWKEKIYIDTPREKLIDNALGRWRKASLLLKK